MDQKDFKLTKPELDQLADNMKLIRESRWMKVYSNETGALRFESKLRGDEKQVSAQDIEEPWRTLRQEEKLEFAMAFSAKSNWSKEDDKVLNFLMHNADEYLMPAIMDLIATHCERRQAVTYLLRRLEGIADSPRSNYYRALRDIGDRSAIGPLQRAYEVYSQQLHANAEQSELSNSQVYIDYLYCCAALRSLEGLPEYDRSIRRMAKHPNEKVRVCAAKLIAKS